MPRLVSAITPTRMGYPQAILGHPLAQRLLGDHKAVAFDQLLECQGWTEVGVAGPDETKDAFSRLWS